MVVETKAFSDRKQEQDWTSSHVKMVYDKMYNIRSDKQIIRTGFFDKNSMPEQAWRLLEDGNLNGPVYFRVPGTIIEVTTHTTMVKKTGPVEGKSRVSGEVSRQVETVFPEAVLVHLQPSKVKMSCGSMSDIVTNDGSGVGDEGRLTAIGSIFGCGAQELEYTNRGGMLSLRMRGMDMRHMALKAYFLLMQTILHQSCGGYKRRGRYLEQEIKHAENIDVLRMFETSDVVVDCSQLSNAQAALLRVLCDRWPIAQCYSDEGTDMYSRIVLKAESYRLYTTKRQTMMVKTDGDFGNSDLLFALIVQLFDHFNCLPQLLEVFKNARGLALTMCKAAVSAAEKVVRAVVNYPLSRAYNGASLGKGSQLRLTETAHFQGTSANLMVDILMGMQAANRLHCIGERLGLFNDKLYSSKNERMQGVLRDHGYAYNGAINNLYTDVMPWSDMLSSVGEAMLNWLYNYALDVRAYIAGAEMVIDSTLIPLLYYDTKHIGLSSWDILRQTREFGAQTTINMATKVTHLAYVRENYQWLKAVGFDNSGISACGMSWIGTNHVPTLNPKLNTATQDLMGTYSLSRVVVAVDNAKEDVAYRNRAMEHLFRPVELIAVQPNCDVPEQRPIGTSVVRTYQSSSGKTRRGAPLDTDDDTASSELNVIHVAKSKLKSQITGTPESRDGDKEDSSATRQEAAKKDLLILPGQTEKTARANTKRQVDAIHRLLERDGDIKQILEGDPEVGGVTLDKKAFNTQVKEALEDIDIVANLQNVTISPVNTFGSGFESAQIPIVKWYDVAGDGSCGLYAITEALNQAGLEINEEIVRKEVGMPNLPTRYQWTDDMLGYVAHAHGVNLMIETHTDPDGTPGYQIYRGNPKDPMVHIRFDGARTGACGHYQYGVDTGESVPIERVNVAKANEIDLRTARAAMLLQQSRSSRVPLTKVIEGSGLSKGQHDTLKVAHKCVESLLDTTKTKLAIKKATSK